MFQKLFPSPDSGRGANRFAEFHGRLPLKFLPFSHQESSRRTAQRGEARESESGDDGAHGLVSTCVTFPRT